MSTSKGLQHACEQKKENTFKKKLLYKCECTKMIPAIYE